ncbi:hypothetical protein BGX28_008725 [Mortierella sp. GBA30]|nr:hypothetical protein BGX28_008725 [Mortierella sp. GBA30]
MDELQAKLTKSADAQHAGNFKDAYFGYLEVLEAAAIELRKIKFIANVAIPSPSAASLISITRTSIGSAQDILARNNAAIAAIAVSQPASPNTRKTSLSRHSERISSGQARTVTMLTEQLQAAAAAAAGCTIGATPHSPPATNSTSAAERHKDESPTAQSPLLQSPTPQSPAPHLRQSPFSSTGTTTPVIYSPLLRAATTVTPPKPTRRPPPSPQSDSPGLAQSELDSIEEHPHELHDSGVNDTFLLQHRESPSDDGHSTVCNDGESDTFLVQYPEGPSDEGQNTVHSSAGGDSILLQHLESPSHAGQTFDEGAFPQPRPPLPPKPIHLFGKISGPRTSEDLSLGDPDESDESDDDEDEPDSAPDGSPQQLHRKTSSPSIAIPTQRRRPGSSASVPASPNHSPSNSVSSFPSPHTSRSFSQTRYSMLRQSSAGTMISIIPEGCVDPTSLVEAERIHGDDEDQLDLKTYGPSDHLPLIPISPLRTSHRTLLEKEKSWSSMLVDAKHRLQERLNQFHTQQDTHRDVDEKSLENDAETQELQDDLRKYKLQIGNVIATINKVQNLLYRSASITSILEFPPYLVAYQLTLVESAIFLEIPPAALLTHSPKSPHKRITASTDFFNYLTRMIEYSILFPPEASGRAQCINHWVKVAVKLHELMNFQTLKAVLSALGTPPIKRLKRTWGFLPRKSANKLEMLSELMSESRNYGKYREMMNSLWAGAALSSPEATSPVSDSSATMSGGRFDILGSWSSSDIKNKEPIRRPMVPFLGTFIMDMTYLIAAVKNGGPHGAASSTSPSSSSSSSSISLVSATSSLRDSKALSVNTTFRPEDDLRVQDLLLTLTAYQSIPRYSPQPPRSFIKASMKSQNHFRAPSLSSALQMTTKYRSNSAVLDRDRSLSSFEDDEDELFGGIPGSGGIRSSQQLILHYLLTRPWVPERMVDELSTIREPSKNNGSYSKSSNMSNASITSWSAMSNTSSNYSQTSSIASTDPRTSIGSESSRPTSIEED